jgi:hypothetical protein
VDVTAYQHGSGAKIELGKIAESIWTQGFRLVETRALQISRPINAPAPNVFDRLTRTQDFSFAAGRSFTGIRAIADALQFLGSHPAAVPAVADIQFVTNGAEIWLNYCGIARVELAQKNGALVVFSYTITGGTWSNKRT